MDDFELECTECGWLGDANELIDGCCPDCGECNSIVSYEPEDDSEE